VVVKAGDAGNDERLADDLPVGIMRYVSARNRSVKLSRAAVLKMILARTGYRRYKRISIGTFRHEAHSQVSRLFHEGVTEFSNKRVPLFRLVRRHRYTDENLADV
jgi:hypothetical protein